MEPLLIKTYSTPAQKANSCRRAGEREFWERHNCKSRGSNVATLPMATRFLLPTFAGANEERLCFSRQQLRPWLPHFPVAPRSSFPCGTGRAVTPVRRKRVANQTRACRGSVLEAPASPTGGRSCPPRFLTMFAPRGGSLLRRQHSPCLGEDHPREAPPIGDAAAVDVTCHELAATTKLALAHLGETERAMLMGGACARAYGWSPKKG